MILSSSPANSTLSSKETEAYLLDQMKDLEIKLSDFIDKTINGSAQSAGIIKSSFEITNFNDPMIVKLPYTNSKGLNSPYINYHGTSTWKKIENSIFSSSGSISFSASGTGKYSVLSQSVQSDDIPENYYALSDIGKLRSRFDLSDVFGSGSSFYPESPASVREVILLYEKASSNAITNSGMDLRQKCSQLGLDAILNSGDAMKDIDRQRYSAVMAKLYVLKMGVDLEALTPSKNVTIKDERAIPSKYFKSVLICLDSGVLALDEKGNFRPNESMSRAEVITALVRLLELTGEI